MIDFMGLFQYWQIYLIIGGSMACGMALNGSIIYKGLEGFDGGGGVTVFLFGAVVSIVVWWVLVREDVGREVMKCRKGVMH